MMSSRGVEARALIEKYPRPEGDLTLNLCVYFIYVTELRTASTRTEHARKQTHKHLVTEAEIIWTY